MNTTTTAMTASVPTARVPDAPTPQSLTSRIVGLYRSGQTKQAEDYVTWAWGNHYHITVKMFAGEWEATHTAPAQNPAALVTDGEVTDGHQAPSALDAILFDFVERQAKARFGEDLPYWRGMAKLLESMSRDARAQHFGKLLGTQTSIFDVWDLYEKLYDTITPLFMTYFAPSALSPEDFVYMCSGSEVSAQMPRMICPCCGGTEFRYDDALTPTYDGELSVSLFCDECDLPLNAKVRF